MDNNTTNAVMTANDTQLDYFGTIQGFESGQRIAKLFASSKLVPATFQNDIGGCLIALNMAKRMGADVLQVMQSLYIVHGKPSFSSAFLIACFNQSGRFSSIRYQFTGEPNTDAWSCKAVTTERATGEIIEGTAVSIAMAKAEGWYSKAGSKWKTMPELMMRYRAATFLIRSVAPEIALGFQTTEEVRDVMDITAQSQVVGDAPTSLAEMALQTVAEDAEVDTTQEITNEETQPTDTLFSDEN